MIEAVRRRVPALSALVALLAGLLLAPALLAHATNTVALFKTPSSANIFLGGSPLLVAEEVAPVGAPGLGAFDLQVTYNANVLTVQAREGPFLASTGNQTACTSSYVGRGDLRFACAAVGAPATGPTGRGVLAYFDVRPRVSLDLRATNDNGIVTLLHDVATTSTLKDVQGTPIPIASAGDTVVVVRRLEGDLNKDCKVDVIDDQMIAARYPAVFGILAYDPQFDLEPTSGDADIDVKDLQFVFGRNSSTCESPVPPQTPPAGETPTIPPTATATSTPAKTAAPSSTGTPRTATAVPPRTRTPAASATAPPTGGSTTTPPTPATAPSRTAGPARTATAAPAGTTPSLITVLPVASTPLAATKTPPDLPRTGLSGPFGAWSSPWGWIAASAALSALGLALTAAAHRRQRR